MILSTHIVSDVEATATDIAIVSRGRLLVHDSPESLLRSVEGKVWEWVTPSADLPALNQQYLISSTIRRSDGVKVRAIAEQQPSATAQIVRADLEDAYLFVVGSSRTGIKEAA